MILLQWHLSPLAQGRSFPTQIRIFGNEDDDNDDRGMCRPAMIGQAWRKYELVRGLARGIRVDESQVQRKAVAETQRGATTGPLGGEGAARIQTGIDRS